MLHVKVQVSPEVANPSPPSEQLTMPLLGLIGVGHPKEQQQLATLTDIKTPSHCDLVNYKCNNMYGTLWNVRAT